MENIPLAEILYKTRVDRGMSLEEVCEGICEISTLARIESGRQIPGRSRMNALLQRLDLPEDRYYAYVSENEEKIEALKKEIVACNSLNRVEEGFRNIEELEALLEPDDRLGRQFILRSRCLLGKKDGRYSPPEILEMLTEAMRMTSPRFRPDRVGESLYTQDEVKILNQMALAYSDLGDHERALDIFFRLLAYLHTHSSAAIFSGVMPMVLYNYARELDICQRYEMALGYAKECQEACIKYGHYQLLPNCLGIYGECCHFLGRRAESIDAYLQSYFLMKALGDTDNMEHMRGEMRAYNNIDIDEILANYV